MKLRIPILAITLAAAGIAFILIAKSPGGCTAVGANHRIVLSDDIMGPTTLSAKLCSRLTFVNEDTQNYYLAFGVHDKHLKYPDFSETTLGPGQELSIVLTKTGTYEVHDHLRDKAKLNLAIKR